MIERRGGGYPAGRSQSSAYRDLVWSVATARDERLDLAGQAAQSLRTLDANLRELGSDKTRIVSAQVFLARIDDKPAMDAVWVEWIGPDPQHWPQRACVGAALGGNWLIEITVVAVRTVP